MFSMISITFLAVLREIFPHTETSSISLIWALNPPRNMLIWRASSKPWVEVCLKKSLSLCQASPRDSSYVCWKEDITSFPLLIFDLGMYLCNNLATTSSHLDKLLGGKNFIHKMASLSKEKRTSTMPHLVHDLSSWCCICQWR